MLSYISALVKSGDNSSNLGIRVHGSLLVFLCLLLGFGICGLQFFGELINCLNSTDDESHRQPTSIVYPRCLAGGLYVFDRRDPE